MALNFQQERIAGFLAQGLKAAQVSSIVGCTPAYISQLAQQEDFRAELQSKVAVAREAQDEDEILSNKYLATEHKILKAVEDGMSFAEFPALVNALKVIGDRQEKRAARKTGFINQNSNGPATVTVNISVPAHALPEYKVNGQQEVVAIGNVGMAPLGAQGVRDLFKARRALEQSRLAISSEAAQLHEQGNGLEPEAMHSEAMQYREQLYASANF